jgi:ATP-dependent exoDNAse (exonuclease V) beta subunit
LAALTGAPGRPGLEEEFVLVQGVADLVVLLPQETWLVDFKTDMMEPGQLAEKLKLYAPQLRIYAAALSRIYRHPVTESWLHFLGSGQAVRVKD